MTWFFAVLVVLLMGAVAVVAAGAGGSMAEVYDDRPDSRVQADGPLTAEDIRTVRFTTALRGYRMSEVDALLERLATELDEARADAARADAARANVARANAADRQGRPETEEGH
ncbi:MAG TPA: DivIVA domain-containing protein [Nocardioidaceae bacterium]|nr:DivIVA domain-containing protein [Nocardioidaceae bacterium]